MPFIVAAWQMHHRFAHGMRRLVVTLTSVPVVCSGRQKREPPARWDHHVVAGNGSRAQALQAFRGIGAHGVVVASLPASEVLGDAASSRRRHICDLPFCGR
jgi:hypothetical protein